MKFEIGEGATVKLDALLSTRLMAQANSGGGKSWLLRRLLEQTHGRVQQFVIDPEGEFATLRQKFDYVLAAKNGGDTLAEPRAAKLLAERLLQLRVSAILDIQELKPTERIEFVQVFLESLIDAPKSLWRPALVVIDEAHVFCPQGGDAASSIAVRDLCARGRKRGYCAVLATQRISKLHKDAVAECNNKLIGRASLDVDMKRCADELGFSKGRMSELRSLKPGEFFAYGPAIETRPVSGARAVSGIVARVHVGPVITQHPKVGARRMRSKAAPPPTRKIRKMLPKLSDLPAEAEQALTTTKQLRAKVVELTNDLRESQNRTPEGKPQRVEVQVIKPKTVRQLAQLVAAFDRSTRALAGGTTGIARLLGKADEVGGIIAGAVASVTGGATGRAVTQAARGGKHAIPVELAAEVQAAANNSLAKPERRLLDALAWFEAIGVRTPEQPAVAFMAGYTYGSGAYNNPRGQLKKKGLITYHSNNQVELTASGRASANYPPRHELATASQLHQSVLARLPQPEQRLLKPLIESWPKAMDQRELSGKAGYAFNSGAFNNPRGRLKSLGLIDYPDKGQIVARDLLFPNLRRK
jgi:hypothetical protein